MKKLTFNYDNSMINDDEIRFLSEKIEKEIINMKKAIENDYMDDRASLNLLRDNVSISKIKELINEKKSLNPEYLILVGIGGSNLGTIAVQESIYGKLHNQKSEDIKILYADTVDSNLINDIIKIIEPVLKKGKKIIINGVSKSGGTTETIANFEILIELLKKYEVDYQKYVVVTSDKGSKFWNLALKNDFKVLEIPKKVGGRFSVFSAVGLFPLGMIGLDIEELIEGAGFSLDKCLNPDIFENPAALSSVIIYNHFNKNINIHDTFVFDVNLESFGKWYRQLMGESIGKRYNNDKKEVYNGMTPTVSIGSTDLHSMAQLYLGGPYDKITTFIKIDNNNSEVLIPNYKEYSELVENIQNRPLEEVMNAIYFGVKKAFEKANRPFMEIILADKSEFSIGQLLQFKMIEMMFLGHLMNVNPFDQPNVEDYKIETKKVLLS